MARLNLKNAIDTDMIHRLAEYYGHDSRIDIPENADEKFFNNHEFMWEKEILQKIIDESRDLFL